MLKVDRYVNRAGVEDEIVTDDIDNESDYNKEYTEALDKDIDELKEQYEETQRRWPAVKECAICGRKQGEDIPGCKYRYWYRRNHLCPDCYKEYCNGLKWKDWPEWVKMLVGESKKLLEAETHEDLIEDMPQFAEQGYINEETGWVEEYRYGFDDPDIEIGNSPYTSAIERDICEQETENEKTKVLHLAIAELDSFDQDIVKLIYWEGMTQEQAASALDVTHQTISVHLQKIQKTMKKYLEDNDLV